MVAVHGTKEERERRARKACEKQQLPPKLQPLPITIRATLIPLPIQKPKAKPKPKANKPLL